MTWNYRIVRRISGDDFLYAIHEAYYDKSGLCDAITQDAVGISGDTLEELREDYKMKKEAFRFPVLDYDTRKDIV